MSDRSRDKLFSRRPDGDPPSDSSKLSDSGKLTSSGKVPAPKVGESGKVSITEIPVEYKCALTSKAWMLSLAPIGISALLVYMGVTFNAQFAPNDTSRFPFVLSPIAMAIFILAVTVVGTRKQLGQRLVVARKEVIFDAGHEDKNFSSPWATLAYSPPHPGKKLVRSLLVSDGKKFAQFYDIFTPDFDKLVADIDKKKTAVTMGSGRLRM